MATSEAFLFGYDFYYLWCSGELARSGGNPYDVQELGTCLTSIGWPAREGVQALTHPPSNFWLYGLFNLLPFEAAKVVWSILSFILMLVASNIWIRGTGRKECNQTDFSDYLLIAAFPAVISNVLWGQINALHFLGASLCWMLYRSKRDFLAGVGFSLCAVKPHLYIAVALYFLVVAAREWRTRIFVGGAFGLVFQLALSWFFFTRGWEFYAARLSSLSSEAITLPGATIAQQLIMVTGARWLPIACASLAVLYGITRGWRESCKLLLLPEVLCVSLLLAPYNWSHGMLGTLPAFIVLLPLIVHSRSSRMVLWFSAILALFSVFFSLKPDWQLIWISLPLIGIAVGLKIPSYHRVRSGK